MDYRFQAEDLLDRIEKFQTALTKEQLLQMIENTIVMAVQDHINEENFSHIKSGQTLEEFKVLLRRSIEYAEKSSEYMEAAYFSLLDLERSTNEDRFIAATLNLTDTSSYLRKYIESHQTHIKNVVDELQFIKKQLKLG